MAVVYEETVSRERVYQCDKCKKTKPMSLVQALAEIHTPSDSKWMLGVNSDKALCPDCVKDIIKAWYKQQEANFQLQGSVINHKRKSRKEVAYQ